MCFHIQRSIMPRRLRHRGCGSTQWQLDSRFASPKMAFKDIPWCFQRFKTMPEGERHPIYLYFDISMVEHQSISGGNYHFNIFHSSTSGLQPSTQSAVQLLHRVPNNFTQDLAGTRKGMKNVYQQCLSILFTHKFYLRV